jgi:hypothetical protein
MLVGVAIWRRRRTANTRDEGAAINGENADDAAVNVGVAVVYNANYRPEVAVVVNLPVQQPRRSIRATCCPIRFPEGAAWPLFLLLHCYFVNYMCLLCL